MSESKVVEFEREERQARRLADRLEGEARREAVRARRRAVWARRTMEEGSGVLVKARARLGASVAARRARLARLTADSLSRRLTLALRSQSHLSSMLDSGGFTNALA